MLDVHPPHEAAHSWRDFLIHIATIVVGLLIAIGLEQTVEFLHHRHEVGEARRALAEERKANIASFHENVSLQRIATAQLENDLLVFDYLQQHPGTPAADLPGVLKWGVPHSSFETNAWSLAQQENLTASMDPKEVAENQQIYGLITRYEQSYREGYEDLSKVGQYRYTRPDVSKLTPVEITKIREGLQTCLRVQYYTMLMLENISRRSDFAPGPTHEELDAMEHYQDDQRLFPKAYALTQQRIDAAKAYDRAHGPGSGR